ncbi:UNVERIFIED_CONTAM: hypothetical protein K2H54_066534, partial [Gekko kuhli]
KNTRNASSAVSSVRWREEGHHAVGSGIRREKESLGRHAADKRGAFFAVVKVRGSSFFLLIAAFLAAKAEEPLPSPSAQVYTFQDFLELIVREQILHVIPPEQAALARAQRPRNTRALAEVLDGFAAASYPLQPQHPIFVKLMEDHPPLPPRRPRTEDQLKISRRGSLKRARQLRTWETIVRPRWRTLAKITAAFYWPR